MVEYKDLEKYVIPPNTNFYGGYLFNGEDKELVDDHDIDKDYDFHVKQKIENSILFTEIEKEEVVKGFRIKEKSSQTTELKPGTLLVYVPGLGFTIPEIKLIKIDEAKGLYDIIK